MTSTAPGGAGSGDDHLARELRPLLRDHAAHGEPEEGKLGWWAFFRTEHEALDAVGPRE